MYCGCRETVANEMQIRFFSPQWHFMVPTTSTVNFGYLYLHVVKVYSKKFYVNFLCVCIALCEMLSTGRVTPLQNLWKAADLF